MHIQWFPGHMTKALRMMEENCKLVDAVLILLDARAVRSCFNPKFDALFAGKTKLYVLNKADLAEEAATGNWLKALSGEDKAAIAVNATRGGDAGRVLAALSRLAEGLLARYAAKGMNRTLRAMVTGVPNVGKSTLINALCGEKRAITGDRPGVTKGKQWVRVSGKVELMDTPGTLYPAFENQAAARHLAFIGSIRDEILDAGELCLELLAELSRLAPQALLTRYGLEQLPESPLDVYEAICRARGFLARGGEYDYERCARAVVDDFRKGRLGRISLEAPDAGV